MIKTIDLDAVFENGVVKVARPKRRLPIPNHTPLKLKLMISLPPATPVGRTRGIIRIPSRAARTIIYGDEADFYGA